MPSSPRIYLDNAATSWPKPEAVYAAVDRYQRDVGAAAGRGIYAEAVQAGLAVDATRQAAASFLGAPSARQIVFTFNGTDALNLALHGVLADGDHVVTTVVEHNSVLRPLRHLQDAGRIRVTRVGCDGVGIVDPADMEAALRPETKLIALCHASNVTGAIQPAAEVAQLARSRGVLFLLDAAQTLGHLPLDVGQLGVDLLAASGHKGLLGPLGTGLLFVRKGVEQRLQSVRQGGTGSLSDSDQQPDEMPDKYESGNLNVPGLVGLGAGIAHLERYGLAALRRHSLELTARLLDGFSRIRGVKVHGPEAAEDRVGVVSITLTQYDPQEVAAMLDTGCRIQVRPGIQCAALMHRALGTLDGGGTVRFSLGCFTTSDEIDTAIKAVQQIAAAAMTV